MKKYFGWFLILFLYIFSDRMILMAYDQVSVEKIIPFANKKSEPSTLKRDPDGGLWILDRNNSTLQKISKEGKTEFSYKPGKSKSDFFKIPEDFCFGSDGRLYVVDSGLKRVVVIEKKKIVNEIVIANPSCIAVSQDDVVAIGDQNQIGIYSKDLVLLHYLYSPEKDGFSKLTAMTFSRDGVLWVLDGSQGKLHRFSPERKWLGFTSGLNEATAIGVDDYGTAYVSLLEGRWKEIDSEGKLAGTFGTKGKESGQMVKPVGLALVSNSLLWVVEKGNPRLQLFSIKNSKKEKILEHIPSARIQVRHNSHQAGSYTCGYIDKQGDSILFNEKKSTLDWIDTKGKLMQSLTLSGKNKMGIRSPSWISEDKDGNLWISDSDDHKLKRIGDKAEVVESIGVKGKKEGNLKNPTYFCFRNDQSVVVVDRGNSRVQVLSPKGLFMFTVGAKGKGPDRLRDVNGVAANQNFIVAIDKEAQALNFYDPNGKFVSSVRNQEGKKTIWRDLASVSSDDQGRFYVLDRELKKLRIYDPDGQFLAEFFVDGDAVASVKNHRVLILGEKNRDEFNVVPYPRKINSLAVKDESGNFRLQWSPSFDAVEYRVYKSSAANSFKPLVTTTATETLDNDVVTGVTYQYALTALNTLGYEGSWSYSDPMKASRRKDVSMISVTTATFNPVFPAAYKYYVSNPIGTVTIKNNDAHEYHDVKVSIGLKKYADYATETIIKDMAAGEEKTVPVTMTFNDSLLELTENTPVQMDIQIHYIEENVERIVTHNSPLILFSRNAISWTDKMRMSSFITVRDMPVVDFSRAAIRTFLIPLKTSSVPKPISKTALLFESVSALGISYMPDPNTPYAEVSGKPEILDFVQYPRETLNRKMGDCDDTTALLSALLESIGVETAIVDTPGHVFMMANTEEANPDNLGFPVEDFVEFRGTYWLPVETTKFGKGFIDAWSTASTEIKLGQEKNQVEFLSVYEASKKYPPVTLTDKSVVAPIYPEEKVKATFTPLLEKLQKQHYEHQLASIKTKIKTTPADESLQLQLGLVHIEGGNTVEASHIFEGLLKSSNLDVKSGAENNLGNISYLSGHYTEAAKHYGASATLSPKDGGVILNQARTAWKLGDNAAAKKYILEAKSTLNDWKDFVGDMPTELLPSN